MTMSLSVYAYSCPPSMGDKWKLEYGTLYSDLRKKELLGTYAFSVSTIAVNQFAGGMNLPATYTASTRATSGPYAQG